MSTPLSPTGATNSWNYKITQFFLKNTRLTILLFLMLVFIGLYSTFMLKTTGFPNPEVKFAAVVATYPGASSETMVREVTQPLEGAIKDVSGVKTYTSFSSNSFTQISVTIDDNANSDSVRNKLDSAIRSAKLPDAVENLKVITPDIGGPDMVLSITSPDYAKLWEVSDRLSRDLLQISDTATVEAVNPLERRVVIQLDMKKLTDAGITPQQVSAQIKSSGETLPVVSNQTIDGQSQTIVTAVPVASLQDLKDLEIKVSVPTTASAQLAGSPAAHTTRSYKLSDLGEITLNYVFKNSVVTRFGLHSGEAKVQPAVIFNIKAVKDTDQNKYHQMVVDKITSYQDAVYAQAREAEFIEGKVLVADSYSVNEDNQKQVHEVISGLIGGPLDVENGVLKHAGWFLGGIQLVFLVMLAFVSWRAALIAAAAIPMSLVFSNIFLYFMGESLNTLVLFSLVLVIGLVVDPALVIMEAIQRKVDAGLKGNQAVLAAVKDVGNGIFLASVTNLIVFFPFGVISGILGQIFRYIPMTAFPAIIGSYIVPLVFLAWLGGLLLKPSRHHKSHDEAENLWPIAKGLIKFNLWLLHGSRWVRGLIILFAVIVSFGMAAFFTGSGQVKSVEFASSEDGSLALLSGSFLPSVSQEEKNTITQDILTTMVQNKYVKQVFPFSTGQGSGLSYEIELTEKKTRSGVTATAITKDLDKQIQEKYGDASKNMKFFDVGVDVISTGPPAALYQISLAVKTSDFEILKKASLDVRATLNQVCLSSSRTVTLDASCADGRRIVTKIDDGFTNRENKVIEVLVDRAKLEAKQLVIPQAPLSYAVNQKLKELFTLNDGRSTGTVIQDGESIDIYLLNTTPAPHTLEEIRNVEIYNLAGQKVKLSDVATIQEKTPKSTIQRVKGQTLGTVQARLESGYDDQTISAQVTSVIVNHYSENNGQRAKDLGLEKHAIEQYSEGSLASFAKSFQELIFALILAVFLTYLVLAVFFRSLTQPLVIIFAVPLTFLGMFPALAYLGGGQLGFLEIIGIIILVGIVENVAIFLIDAARQKMEEENWDMKRAISYAAGIRLRPVLLTKLTAIASLAPLVFLSELYRSISIVIIFGLITSGFLSLITTPILFVFFKWFSNRVRNSGRRNTVIFAALNITAIGCLVLGVLLNFGLLLLIGLTLLVSGNLLLLVIWATQDWVTERRLARAKQEV